MSDSHADPSLPLPANTAAPDIPQVLSLGWGAPWRWLVRGAQDLIAHPGIALFYGFCFWCMALVLGWVFRSSPEYTMSIVSGCLLVGPFLAMGLYDVSRRRGRGETPALGHSITCWDSHVPSMGMLVLVLIVLELLWGRASLVVFAVFFNTGMPSTTGVLKAIFNPGNWEFVLVYLAVGGIFATLVFSTMVVSVPMILDRDTDAITAGLTSMRVVYENTGVMLLWAALIVGLTALALWPWGTGLLVLGPLLGHASWHAYCDSVGWQPAAPDGGQPSEAATVSNSH
jgi:uncharacterized membrane protein